MPDKKMDEESPRNENSSNQPWIQMKTGVIIIAFLSVVMAVLSAVQAVPVQGWLNGILFGLMNGIFIWALFFFLLIINRWLRGR